MDLNKVVEESVVGYNKGINYKIDFKWVVENTTSRYYKYRIEYQAEISFDNEEFVKWYVNRYEDRVISLQETNFNDFGYDHYTPETMEKVREDSKKRLTQNLIYQIETSIRSYYAEFRYQQFEQNYQYPDTILKYASY